MKNINKKKKSAYHHGDLHRALIDAALDLVNEEGVLGLTLRKVARRAGVSHSAPYHHFTHKSALLAAVAEEGFHRLERAFQDAEAGKGSPKEHLKALGVAYVHFAVKNPSYFRVMFRPELADPREHPSLAETMDQTHAHLVDAVKGCLSGDDTTGIDPANVALVAWSVVHGLASLWVDGPLPNTSLGAPGIEKLAVSVTNSVAKALPDIP